MAYEVKSRLEQDLFAARGALEKANTVLAEAEKADGAAVARIIAANAAKAAAINGESKETVTEASLAKFSAEVSAAQDWGKATSNALGRARAARNSALEKFEKAAFAERMHRYGIKALRYIEALEKLAAEFYQPVIAVFEEDSRRLTSLHNPFLSADSLQFMRTQIELMVNGAAPKPLAPGMVKVRFIRSFAGSYDTLSGSLENICAYSKNECAAFKEQLAKALIAEGYCERVAEYQNFRFKWGCLMMMWRDDENEDENETTGDQGGILPSQWVALHKAQKQFDPEVSMWIACFELTCTDLKDWFARRRPKRDAHGSEHTLKKARKAFDWIHSDTYGGDDPNFVSCRMICALAEIDLVELRKYMLTFGTREDLDKINFKFRKVKNYRKPKTAIRLSRTLKDAA